MKLPIVAFKLRNAPTIGYFGKFKPDGFFLSVDRNKSYTSLLREIKYFPVFNIFDNYKVYDHHELEDYTQYLIKVENNMKNTILFEGIYSKCYGYILKKIQRDCEILYFRRPSNLVESNSEENIDKLFNTEISNDNQFENAKKHQKFISNINIGKLEKRINKCNLCKIYLKKAEAYYYANLYGGIVHEIEDDKMILDPECENNDVLIRRSEKHLYLLQIKKELQLIEGFIPIKDFIYNLQRYYNYVAYDTLTKHNIPIVGVSTDALLVATTEKQLPH